MYLALFSLLLLVACKYPLLNQKNTALLFFYMYLIWLHSFKEFKLIKSTSYFLTIFILPALQYLI